MYAFIIAEDCIDHGTEYDTAGITGPRTATAALIRKLKDGKGRKFRMKDDDGEVYYTGRIVGDFDGFEPLDDFGTPNAGATSIEYFNWGSPGWKTL